jgi:hypothetical protein
MLLEHRGGRPSVDPSAYVALTVGNPARTIAPWDHDEIWRIQEALDFPRTV